MDNIDSQITEILKMIDDSSYRKDEKDKLTQEHLKRLETDSEYRKTFRKALEMLMYAKLGIGSEELFEKEIERAEQEGEEKNNRIKSLLYKIADK